MTAMAQTVQVEQIRAELESHLAEIPIARSHVLSITALPPGPTDSARPTAAKSHFMAKITAPFKSAQQLFQEQKTRNIGRPEDVQPLLTACQDSAYSENTLVQGEDLASRTLAVLAPLVSGLQKLSPRIETLHTTEDDLPELFDKTCVEVLRVIVCVNSGLSPGGEGDAHDLEMCQLMLSALTKKVELVRKVSQKLTLGSKAVTTSPKNSVQYLPPPHNPFVLHSSSLTLSRPSTGAKAVGVPIQPAPFTSATTQSFSSFAGDRKWPV